MSGKTRLVFLNSGLFNFDKKLDFNCFLKDGSIQVTHFESSVGCTDEEILNRIGDNEIIITKEMPMSSHIIHSLPSSAKVVIEAGTGFNNLPVEDCKSKGIAVLNIPEYSSEAVASLVITHMMNHASGIISQQLMLSKSDKSNFLDHLRVPCFELAGKTIGLIGGRGKIGSNVCKFASVLGMKVIISSRSAEAAVDANVTITNDLHYLLSESDFVSLHCPLTSETKAIINAKTLAKMKPSCHLINTARGALIDEEALCAALENGVIHSCSLDVTTKEPLDESSSLWNNPKVILTPHMGWRRIETRQRLVNMVWDNVQSWIQTNGQSPINRVA